jgi:transcriptional regulator with XRE-family HTH domain
MSYIAENIRKIRSALGYSQEYVAKRMHMSQQTYSNLERSPEDCSLKRLKELAGILKIELITLIGEDETLNQTNLHQTGGNAATKMIINEASDTTELILQLKSEIDYLRTENSQLLRKIGNA